MKDSLLNQSEIIGLRNAINRYIEARGWMRRNHETASQAEVKRYEEVSDSFDSLWSKYRHKMSPADIDKFNEMLESDTVIPENKKHQVELEMKPKEQEETVLEGRPDDFKEKKKVKQVKQIKAPNLKKNQPELF